MTARIVALAAVLAASLLALAPATAGAEEEDQETCAVDVCLEGFDVFGTVPQPMVFVIDRGRLEIHPVRANESFTREIVESLHRAPF